MSQQKTSLEGKRIAFFHQSSDMYGSDKILLYLAQGVQQLGGQPVVLLPDTGPLTVELQARSIEFHTVPMLKLSRARFSPKGMLGLLREMRSAKSAYDDVFQGRKVDLVHSNTIAVLGGAMWARSHRIPHLWHVHEIIEHPWFVARLFPLLLRLFADQVVCNSRATYEWLFSAQASLQKKMRVIWNGILAPELSDASAIADMRQRFRPTAERLSIGLVGRINRWKGQGLLMEAVEILHAKGLCDFSVVFMGSAPPGQAFFETELRERIARSPMREHVFIQDFSRDIWPAYAALDIVCVPSTEPEPFGLVATEAMAAGRPVVASRFGGLTEIVQDGITGLSFEPRDAEALANALEQLLRDDGLRERMGQAGKARFAAEFSVNRMMERFGQLYFDMVGGKE